MNLSRYSLPITIVMFTTIALIFTIVGIKLLSLAPYFAGALGVGFGALFMVGLMLVVQYGSTIEPITEEEYHDLNDPEQGGLE